MNREEIRRRLDGIGQRVEVEPVEMRLEMLKLVGELVHADRGLLYCVVMRDGQPYYVDLQAYGPPSFVAAARVFEGVCINDLGRRVDEPARDHILENPFFEEGFVAGDTNLLRDAEIYPRFFEPQRLGSLIGLNIIVDGRMAGWAGVYRTFEQPGFARRELDAVKAWEKDLQSLYGATISFGRWQIPENGAVAVLDRNGRVTQVFADAPMWFREGRICSALRDEARDFAQSTESRREVFVRRHAVTLTRLIGSVGESVHARIVPAPGQPVPALVQLSKRQREVAQALLTGATIAEVARSLGMSPETVRTHLKAIYAHFGVSTRVELSRVLRG